MTVATRIRNLQQRLHRLGSTLDTKHIRRPLDPTELALKDRIETNFPEWKKLVSELDDRVAMVEKFREQFLADDFNIDEYRKWDEESGKKVQYYSSNLYTALVFYVKALSALRYRITLFSPPNKKLW